MRIGDTVLTRGKLLSIQVGGVRDMALTDSSNGRPVQWSSGIYKDAVGSPVRITAGGMEGDQQSDLDNHGGPDNVVLAYDAGHYADWRARLAMPEMAYGSFGENFTVSGFSDEDVCIGDVWRVGPEVLLQVTQPRQPCFKLARRLGRPEIVKLVMESSRGGWYLRVLREGMAAVGMEISLLERRHPEWTVARAVQTMYARKVNAQPAKLLAALPELSTRWKQELLQF